MTLLGRGRWTAVGVAMELREGISKSSAPDPRLRFRL